MQTYEMKARFELQKMIFPSQIHRSECYVEVIENVPCGFLWRKTRQILHKVYGSSTVWHDYSTGERIDPSPLSRFIKAKVALQKRPIL
ncbi:hypothetical protein EVB81_252 [Rhizobium phage RHph_I46]|uniref:Uncharacterized protein n=1 Tax=Rhizobium phage RHph_I1_9 TaxID=2509729 RepID=A0A7S5R9V8_9CAUD|nr:hypothetical protein PP936_gp250 [Rhizobium phage RHph_I1_9]QIG69821.1 hypothetical protein EVB81_252 [Rhizobium phage RHph_I46]QIG71102.1 hypothetical protein EVB92_252 [Rhizobium phage RHph_I9]QIG73687.1 hypothetical protein EVC04_250 [Rhizobium phage RHph_I1_9]QIG76441.1 hypothetical protein EVC25_252 [Rhizobium phage RHph_I34]